MNTPPTTYSRVETAVVRGATAVWVSSFAEIVSVTPSKVLVAGGLDATGPSGAATTGAAVSGSAVPGSADAGICHIGNAAPIASTTALRTMDLTIFIPTS